MLIVAHRGASARAPENSLEAFRLAVDHADAVEFDVRLTADGALVLMHDDDIERTTGLTGRLSAMSLTDARALRLLGPDGARSDQGVPTFEETLELLAGKVGLFVEVKGAWTGTEHIPASRVVDAIAPLIAGVPRVTVSSFDPDAVSHARRTIPDVPTGLAGSRLTEPQWVIATAIERGFDEVHPPQEQTGPDFIARSHAAALRVVPWTVNDPARANELAAQGCDGIFTDDPEAMRAALSG